MTALVVLVFAAGVFVIYDALSAPARGIARVPRWRRRLEGWLADAGLAGTSVAQLAAVTLAAALGAGSAVVLAVSSPVVASIATVAGGCVPVSVVRSRGRARRRVMARAWPEAVDLLAGSVRMGDTLPAATSVVAERGPDALRPAFRSLAADHRVGGDFAGALERLGDALGDPTADRVVATLALAHHVGGRDLVRVLRTLAAFLREDLAIRREIEARQSWTVVAARVAAVAPWLVLVLVAGRPQSARAFDSLAGVVILLGGAAATVVGYRLMVAVGRLPEEPRFVAARPRGPLGSGA